MNFWCSPFWKNLSFEKVFFANISSIKHFYCHKTCYSHSKKWQKPYAMHLTLKMNMKKERNSISQSSTQNELWNIWYSLLLLQKSKKIMIKSTIRQEHENTARTEIEIRSRRKKLILTLRTWCGILMSMIMIVMPIWIGIGWIVVTFQYISIRCWCRQRMISFEIKLEFVMMGFDLLLMLIINLTVFLIISGFFRTEKCVFLCCCLSWSSLMLNDAKKWKRKEMEKNVEYWCFKKK